MSTENFKNNDEDKSGQSEPVKIPSETTSETKKMLLDLVIEKSQGGHDLGGSIGRAYQLPGVEWGSISAESIKGENSQGNLVGRIWKWERIGKERLESFYDITRSPDGLQLAKRVRTRQIRPIMPVAMPVVLHGNKLVDASHNELLGRIGELRSKIEDESQSLDIENELGLSIVSQSEAGNLLETLRSAQPFPKPDLSLTYQPKRSFREVNHRLPLSHPPS